MKLGPYTFPIVDYDALGDVVYLRLEDDQGGEEFYESPEGHAFLQPIGGPAGEVVGVNLLSPRLKLARYGLIVVTLPDGSIARLAQIERLVG